ncbi:hypothetical protein Mapa_002318 [Marchantia paleacea]|nr:hypothetical protein Mapa_002318 [Marchantia paleacea]
MPGSLFCDHPAPNLSPLEGWYDTEEPVSYWKPIATMVKSVQFGGGGWALEPLGDMYSHHVQSSWIPTVDGRKRFHRDVPLKSSSPIVQREQVSEMTGGPQPQDMSALPLSGGWNEQILSDVLHVPTQSQPLEVESQHVTNHSERSMQSEDLNTVMADRPTRMYMEHDVPGLAARLLLTDENSNEGGNVVHHKITNEVSNDFTLVKDWDPRSSMTDYHSEKVLRNQKNLYAAETSNANDRNLWTPFLPVASVPSARSVRSEGRQSEIEVKMDQNCHGEIPNLIPDRNGHMQGIRQAVRSLGGHAVQIGEINQHKAFADSSQLPGFLRRTGFFDSKSPLLSSINFLQDDRGQSATFLSEAGMLTSETQNSKIPFHTGTELGNFTGRSVETLSTPRTVAVSAIQPKELSLQVPTASPLSMLPTATKFNLFGGSNQSSQVPRVPLHLTPSLQHPPQPMEQMVGVQQSFRISSPIQNGCLPTSPGFQENLQTKLISDIGQSREEQLHNSNWENVISGLDQGAVYKQPQQSLSQGLPPDLDIHGGSFDGNGVPPDWISNEALVIQQLQATMLQLDVGTRMCIRDALYRLAKSAKERRSCRTHNAHRNLAEPDKSTVSSSITCDDSRCESEKQTNHVDRSIASLLFNTGPIPKYGLPPAYKFRSVSQPLSGVQTGPWLWPSTGMMGNNCASSSGKYAESPGVAKVLCGDHLNNNWAALPLVTGFRAPNETAIDSRVDHDSYMRVEKSVSPDNYQHLEMQADRLNMPLSSAMRSSALVSANEAMNFDSSAAPSRCSMIPEGMRQEGDARGQEQREVGSERDQGFVGGSSLVDINYQSALMPYREDVGNEVAAVAPSLQEEGRVENIFFDGGNFQSKFCSESGSGQFANGDGYARMTARNGGHMFGGDMNSLRAPHRNQLSGKEELDMEGLWHT